MKFIRSFVNTFLIVTFPVWGGLVFLVACALDYELRKDLLEATKGDKWWLF